MHTNLGTTSTAAKEFCEDHGQLMEELKVKFVLLFACFSILIAVTPSSLSSVISSLS